MFESDSIIGVDERTIGNTPEYAEYYEKIDETQASKLDGMKHIANVRYVNGVAVDTIGVPDSLDDKYSIKEMLWLTSILLKLKKVILIGEGLSFQMKITYKEDNLLVETFNLSTKRWRATGGVWPPTPYDIEWIDDGETLLYKNLESYRKTKVKMSNFIRNESKEVKWFVAYKELNNCKFLINFI